MMQTLAILAFFCAVQYLIWVRMTTLLTYFQQDEYDAYRYVTMFFKVRLFDVRCSMVLICGALVRYFVPADEYAVVQILECLLIFAIAWNEGHHRYKRPLVFTARAQRIYWISFVLVSAFTPFFLMDERRGALVICLVQSMPLVMILTNGLLAPFQRKLNRFYIEDARCTLDRMNPVRIGITGSFGKTTVKYILAELLSVSGAVFYSRGSVNTQLGLSRHIRERLQWGHRWFIAEMGAYGIGSIRNICDFIKPSYGIVTCVGDAHIERFGCIENTALAKSELVESACKAGGLVVVDADVLRFDCYHLLRERHPGQMISVGYGKDADVCVERAEFCESLWQVELRGSHAGSDIDLCYTIPLLGRHDVMNSALAVVLAWKLSPETIDRMASTLASLEAVPHRLQKRCGTDGVLVIDDSFNSNAEGFKGAIESSYRLACQRGGKLILVTPGLVELGMKHDSVHRELGVFCKNRCARVYVVNPSRIDAFVLGLCEAGVDYVPVATLSEAKEALRGRETVGERDVLLYENDLPDVLEERRFL